MIETQQSVVIPAPIGQDWTYANYVECWAEIMPGYKQCEITGKDNSS